MHANKKLAIFLHNLRGGGAERMMVNLAGGIVQKGFDLDIILVEKEGAYLDLLPPSARVVDLGLRRVAFSPLALARYLRRERPAVLLSALLHVNIAAVIAGMLAPGIRIVISERNTVSVDDTNIASWGIKAARWLAPYLYPKADAIIAVSIGVARDLSEFAGIPRDRIQSINNPVVTDHMLRRAAEPVTHPWFGNEDVPVILGVGRLTEQKDFATLVRAFAELRRRRPAKLVILGEGDLRGELVSLVNKLGIDEDVDLPGFAENPYAHMAKADLFVLSSSWEGSPNVLVEAMACGAPVVSTDCPSGPQEILNGGEYGPLVRIGDEEGLSKAMGAMLDNPTPAVRLKTRAADYSVEKSTDAYLRVLLPDRDW